MGHIILLFVHNLISKTSRSDSRIPWWKKLMGPFPSIFFHCRLFKMTYKGICNSLDCKISKRKWACQNLRLRRFVVWLVTFTSRLALTLRFYFTLERKNIRRPRYLRILKFSALEEIKKAVNFKIRKKPGLESFAIIFFPLVLTKSLKVSWIDNGVWWIHWSIGIYHYNLLF